MKLTLLKIQNHREKDKTSLPQNIPTIKLGLPKKVPVKQFGKSRGPKGCITKMVSPQNCPKQTKNIDNQIEERHNKS